MFKNILVPTDLSLRTQQAVDIAIRLTTGDSRIALLHVIETIEDSEFDEFEEFYGSLKRRAQRKMSEIMKPYADSKIPMEKVITYGRRVQEIVKFAADRKIDLVVLSSHKVDLDNPSEGLGTISYKVGFLSPCPVLLIK